MYPEDRVLVGVVRRMKDVRHLLAERWYRIPYERMTEGVSADVLAFFCPSPSGARGVYYYARLQGVELVRRLDLLPDEPRHPRAHALYYKCQLGDIHAKTPPILNPERRAFAFIYTTYDRFCDATRLSTLYSKDTGYVNRLYYARPQGQARKLYWLS
jgi:hypothetical protein